jgi:hypothetical protein
MVGWQLDQCFQRPILNKISIINGFNKIYKKFKDLLVEDI